jgi:hypothetical protein
MDVKIINDWTNYTSLGFSFFGLLSFLWIVWYEVKTYLRICVNSSNNSVITSITNRSIFKREISNSFIIISKSDNDFLDELKKLFPQKEINYTNDLKDIKEKSNNEKIYFIPVDFYYSENVRIADEDLSYSVDLEPLNIPDGSYEVRFFVFPKAKRLHRSSQCIVTVNHS